MLDRLEPLYKTGKFVTFYNWLLLACFAVSVMAASLQLLAASGHFPKHVRTDEIGKGAGPFILYSTMAAALAAVAVSLWLILRTVPWYAAVLGGGIAALSAPLVLANFSDEFVDGKRGLIVFAALACIALACMWLIT
jgi:hypothetical protein